MQTKMNKAGYRKSGRKLFTTTHARSVAKQKVSLCLAQIAIGVQVLMAQTSSAQDLRRGDTVYGLLQDCQISEPKSELDIMNSIACRSYIAGLRDIMQFVGLSEVDPKMRQLAKVEPCP
jgi:hypothetical protein